MMKAIGSLRPGMENSLMIDGVGFSRRDEVLDPSRDATWIIVQVIQSCDHNSTLHALVVRSMARSHF